MHTYIFVKTNSSLIRKNEIYNKQNVNVLNFVLNKSVLEE